MCCFTDGIRRLSVVCRRHTLFETFLFLCDYAITVCCYWVLKLVLWLFLASKGQRSPFLCQKTSKSGLKQRISHVIGKSKITVLKPVDIHILYILMVYWLNFRHPKVKGHCFVGQIRSESAFIGVSCTLSAKVLHQSSSQLTCLFYRLWRVTD